MRSRPGTMRPSSTRSKVLSYGGTLTPTIKMCVRSYTYDTNVCPLVHLRYKCVSARTPTIQMSVRAYINCYTIRMSVCAYVRIRINVGLRNDNVVYVRTCTWMFVSRFLEKNFESLYFKNVYSAFLLEVEQAPCDDHLLVRTFIVPS